jgi:hypothetical protein
VLHLDGNCGSWFIGDVKRKRVTQHASRIDTSEIKPEASSIPRIESVVSGIKLTYSKISISPISRNKLSFERNLIFCCDNTIAISRRKRFCKGFWSNSIALTITKRYRIYIAPRCFFVYCGGGWINA